MYIHTLKKFSLSKYIDKRFHKSMTNVRSSKYTFTSNKTKKCTFTLTQFFPKLILNSVGGHGTTKLHGVSKKSTQP